MTGSDTNCRLRPKGLLFDYPVVDVGSTRSKLAHDGRMVNGSEEEFGKYRGEWLNGTAVHPARRKFSRSNHLHR